ncbi:MAG: hypothetical protein Q9164_007515 [Protoblastenia rupestris]
MDATIGDVATWVDDVVFAHQQQASEERRLTLGQNVPTAELDTVQLVSDLVKLLRKRVEDVTRGEAPDNQLMLDWRAAVEEWRNDILVSRPVVFPGSGFEDHWHNISLASATHRQHGTKVTLIEEVDSALASQARAIYSDETNQYTLAEIRATLRDYTNFNRGSVVDSRAEEALITRSLRHWQELLLAFLGRMQEVFDTVLTRAIDQALGAYTSSTLARRVKDLVKAYLQQPYARLRDISLEYLSAELYRPMTFSAQLEDLQRIQIKALKKHRVYARKKAFVTAKCAAGEMELKATPKEQRAQYCAVTYSALLDDPYNVEVEAFGRVKGYYLLAGDRMIDVIEKYVQLKLWADVRQDLGTYLESRLWQAKGKSPEECNALLRDG